MYSKSEIMKKAHSLYNAGGLTQSEALRNAWRIAKIDNQLFALNMVDHQSDEQKATVRRLNAERRNLTAKPAVKPVATTKTKEELWADYLNALNNNDAAAMESIWSQYAA